MEAFTEGLELLLKATASERLLLIFVDVKKTRDMGMFQGEINHSLLACKLNMYRIPVCAPQAYAASFG